MWYLKTIYQLWWLPCVKCCERITGLSEIERAVEDVVMIYCKVLDGNSSIVRFPIATNRPNDK